MSEVLVERRDAVLVITLNRPHARNALNVAVAQQVQAAVDELEDDATLRVGVLTGAEGTFCSGLDLKAAANGEFPMTARRGPGGPTFGPPAKPLIAAVEGYAVAGGFEMALGCDLIVTASDAQFGIPEVKRTRARPRARRPTTAPVRSRRKARRCRSAWTPRLPCVMWPPGSDSEKARKAHRPCLGMRRVAEALRRNGAGMREVRR